MTTTAEQFAAMLATERSLWDAVHEGLGNDPRASEATEALVRARPIDPASMAAHLQWLIGLEGSLGEDGDRILEHVAGQLERLANMAWVPVGEAYPDLDLMPGGRADRHQPVRLRRAGGCTILCPGTLGWIFDVETRTSRGKPRRRIWAFGICFEDVMADGMITDRERRPQVPAEPPA